MYRHPWDYCVGSNKMNKELKDYTYGELIDYLTGRAIMSLGQGESLRSIIAHSTSVTVMWVNLKQENQETKKKK